MNKVSVFALLISLLVAGGLFAETKPAVKASNGVVVSVSATSLVVKVGTKDETFVVDAKTTFVGKDKKAVIADLKAGEKVEVKFTVDAAKKESVAVSVTQK